MAITIGEWIFIVLLIVAGGVLSVAASNMDGKFGIGVALLSIMIVGGVIFAFNWYNTSTATGIRNYKDFKSEMSNGIYREIKITAEDGRQIFEYEGKFDVERHEDGDDRYLRFETQDGKRYTISYGVQDTVIIVEKPEKEGK